MNEKKYVIAYTKEFGEVSVVFHHGYIGAGINIMSSVRGELWNHYHNLAGIPCILPAEEPNPDYLIWPGLSEEQRNKAADMLYYMGWTLNYQRQSLSSLGDLVRLGVVKPAAREKLLKQSVELQEVFQKQFEDILKQSDVTLALETVDRNMTDDIRAKHQKLTALKEEVKSIEKELEEYECITKTDN